MNAEDYGDNKWMGSDNDKLVGFPWTVGCDPMTTGILIWSQVFVVPGPDGEEVAVVLMDTQGTFDRNSTVNDCTTIFALSIMISSVQVYNVSQNLQEDDLQHLHFFSDYGKLAMESTSATPFQSLMFLIRDWSYPYEHSYGVEGGEEFLEKTLKVTDTTHEELLQVRNHIRSCFERISCFLLPHPGLKVATNPKFDGRISDMEENFRSKLCELVPLLLGQNNLVVKSINGTKITAGNLLHYFKVYMDAFQNNELPNPTTILQATAEANNLSAVANALDFYKKSMEQVCGGDQTYLNPKILESENMKYKEESIDQFRGIPKMGGEELSQRHLQKLQDDIDALYTIFCEQNNSKRCNYIEKWVTAGVTSAVVTAAVGTTVVLAGPGAGVVGLVALAVGADTTAIIAGASAVSTTVVTTTYGLYRFFTERTNI